MNQTPGSYLILVFKRHLNTSATFYTKMAVRLMLHKNITVNSSPPPRDITEACLGKPIAITNNTGAVSNYNWQVSAKQAPQQFNLHLTTEGITASD
jgi:hypothetical protein